MPKENIWNVPNLLTMLRMALIGVFIWLFSGAHYLWALAVFLLAGATDVLDGYIARKHNLITNFGKLMDPLADKLMLITALICLMTIGRVPVWAVAVVAGKELIMVIGGSLLLRRGIVVQAQFLGKAATALFLLAVVATFFHDTLAPWDYVLLCLAVTVSISALVFYAADAVKKIKTA